MNRNKNTASKKGTVALLGMTADNQLVINPAIQTKDAINFMLNAVNALLAPYDEDAYLSVINAFVAQRNPELVFGSREELEAEIRVQDAAVEGAVNPKIDEEIAELKEKVKAHVESED